MSHPAPQMIDGCESWRLNASHVSAALTAEGGHLGAVTFDLDGQTIRPMHTALWAHETSPPDLSAVERILRGDFFCLPFGMGSQPHGKTSNARWTLDHSADNGRTLTASMDLQPMPGRVEKTVRLIDGHTAIYQRHRVTGVEEPCCFGHHAMLRFPDDHGCARISTSPFVRGQVAPGPIESPPRGNSALQPEARFDRLDRVPAIDGGNADLTRYPARRGNEDIVQVFADPARPLAWSAASVVSRGYCWFSLRPSAVLTGTMLWMSNGGRSYPPWSGRHTNVLGIEDVTSYFHLGQEASVAENPASREGMTTALPGELDVRYLWGVVAVPPKFGRVETIEPVDAGISITDQDGLSVFTTIDLNHLSIR